jgi:hypothetical protein
MVAGVASGHGGAQAVAQAASWDQDVLAGHGCRISPRTGLRVPPSASMLDRLPRLLDADEFEAAPSACLAQAALDPAIPAAYSCPPPEDTGFENAQQAILIERYTTGNYCVRDSTVTYMPVISGELVLGTPL